jgi:hypothetical protein
LFNKKKLIIFAINDEEDNSMGSHRPDDGRMQQQW